MSDPHTPEEAEEFIAAVYRRLAEDQAVEPVTEP